MRDSVPDWTPFREPPAPEGAPNVLLVLYDDTGLAAWSPYGGRINMPTMQKLADNGLTYTQWHTTALCSPTRSCLLTGRNHHQNGFAQIAEGAQGFPGHTGHIPMENATIGEVLRENGYNTFWVGKNHNVPARRVGGGRHASATGRWPAASTASTASSAARPTTGTRRWSRTTTTSTSPRCPRRATTCPRTSPTRRSRFIADSKTSAPKKPWYLWFCPGANHAPHHAPRGVHRQVRRAVRRRLRGLPRVGAAADGRARASCPRAPALTDINPLPGEAASRWTTCGRGTTLSDDEKRLFSRLAEVYAGFSEYTDAQVGRIIDYLEETGQLDNTIVMYCADNGASGEGSPDGTVNENKFFNA